MFNVQNEIRIPLIMNSKLLVFSISQTQDYIHIIIGFTKCLPANPIFQSKLFQKHYHITVPRSFEQGIF